MSDFLNPKKVIEELPLEDDISIADFGCGSGGWVIPLAKKIKNVKIYALDILEPALSALRANAELEKVYNIRTIRCDIERGTEFQDSFLDMVIMSNLLFQVEEKNHVIREGFRVLKNGGKLVVVDWIIESDNAEELIHQKVQEEGFHFIKKLNAGESHFANLYEKK